MKSLIGAAWKEAVKGAPDRAKFNVSLDLGMSGTLTCRIVENTSRTEDAPTHLIFYSPIEGQDVKVGALWPYGDAPYLIGHIDLAAFGKIRLKGGIEIDFRLAGDRIGVRLSAVAERRNEKSPTHQLWRMRPRGKSAVAIATPVTAESSEEAVEEVKTLLDGERFGDGEVIDGDDESAEDET